MGIAGAMAWAIVLCGAAEPPATRDAGPDPPSPPSADAPVVPVPPTPSGDAPVAAMVSHGSWIRRMIGAMRLERPQA